MAISRYTIWFTVNRRPSLVSGLSFPWKSTPISFEMKNATGTSGAAQQNVSRFFVRIGSPVRWTQRIPVQMRTDVRMNGSPF